MHMGTCVGVEPYARCLDTHQWVYLCRVHMGTHIDSVARQAEPQRLAAGEGRAKRGWTQAGRAIPGQGPFYTLPPGEQST